MRINIGFLRKEDPKKYDRIWRRLYNKRTGNVKRKLADYKYIDKKNSYRDICDYTYNELLYILSTNKCIYCGGLHRLGLDRIDNTNGHTKDNTVVSCYICNTLRGDDYTSEEMKLIQPLLNQIGNIRIEIKKTLSEYRSKSK